jgi:hypothetical protein
MKRYIVLGVNENPKYLYYLPLVTWGWYKLGWLPIIFHPSWNHQYDQVERLAFRNIPIYCQEEGKIAPINKIDGYKSETISQVSRLYGACQINDAYLMTSDVDMLPLSDYWFANIGLIDCYGRDLTDYHYPICYIGMESYLWRKVMWIPDHPGYPTIPMNTFLERDLRHQKNMWGLDQDLITERLVKYQINRIDRGTDKRTGYPLGRVDRSNWRLDHDQLIDAHLPHDILTNDKSFHKVMELLHTVWPKEDFKWFTQYHKEFKKLL